MSTSNFDSSLDSHADLVNKRTSGNPIAGEKHTTPGVSPYTVIMGEVPDDDETVTISGAGISWTEVEYAPTASGEYQVDYVRGIITFYNTDTNKVVYFAYTGLGNCMLADHINDRTYSSIQIQRVIGVDARGPCQRYPSIADRLSKTVGRLEAYADESVPTKIQIAAGRFSLNPAAIYEMGGYSMDFGAAGTHQLAPIPVNNYKRIVVMANQGARYKVYAGPPSASATPLPPTMASYITEAAGQPVPKDADDAVDVVIDRIQLDRKHLTMHTLNRRALVIANQSIQTAVAALTVPPVRKAVVLGGGQLLAPILP